MSANKHLFILKHSAGISATGRNMVRRKERESGECPRCGSRDEHTEHIILCPQEDATSRFNTAVEEIRDWLDTSTDDDIKEAIMELISEYRTGSTHPDVNETDDEFAHPTDITKRNQREIGLHAFMCGFLCKDWAKQQATYFERRGSRKCARTWVAQLAGKLIDIIFDMWTHRNDTLHNQNNKIKEQRHDELNKEIKTIYSDLPPM